MTPFQVLGWVGNACFFSRFLVQWALSERARRSLTPTVFWRLSLVGTACLGVYSAQQGKYVLLVGYVLNGTIYARNLWMQRRAGSRTLTPGAAALIALVAVAGLVAGALLNLRTDPDASAAWVACAGVGQAIWSSRFVVQWWLSERAGESHFPPAFWWLSLFGNALLLAYALHLGDPIFIAGFVPGPIVQVRNLMLQRRATTRA
ncbi:MAG TPA: lipid-A-disaccharide synthase N-terminal domain-containing protein [Planctomycetota bacterium]|nr:lipid-A-disaccharide synthase N-terminal domain-containing protein [Planctomycetota bacterium]